MDYLSFHTNIWHKALYETFVHYFDTRPGEALRGPVLKVDAHSAHVRGTEESWGDQKAG